MSDSVLPGSSIHGIFQAKYWSGLPCPSPGDLSDPGIELESYIYIPTSCTSILNHLKNSLPNGYHYLLSPIFSSHVFLKPSPVKESPSSHLKFILQRSLVFSTTLISNVQISILILLNYQHHFIEFITLFSLKYLSWCCGHRVLLHFHLSS